MVENRENTERRHREASVVFADIAGFTALSEQLGPEGIAELMEECFHELERIILAHGGTIDKYIGDCVMALFGAERALEDSAAHALRASLEMRDAVTTIRKRRNYGADFGVHIGVNTGPLLAGDVGGEQKRSFSVLGDTVNVAARLQSKAETGIILVGPETFSLTADRFAYQSQGSIELKGKAAPIEVYALDEAHDTRGTAQTLGATTRHASTPLIGRTEERRILGELFSALEQGQGSVVLLSGDAGMGKSRTLFEMREIGSSGSLNILIGRSQTIGSRSSYQPFRDMLCQLSGIENENDSGALQALTEVVYRVAPETAEAILPFLGRMLALELPSELATAADQASGESLRILMQKAIADVLVGVARERPLVLCFEDFHWADQSSVELAESLLWMSRDLPVQMLFVARPGFEESSTQIGRAATGQDQLRFTEVQISPLSPSECRDLALALLAVDKLPLELHELITVRSGGNPFHVEEIVRTLKENPKIEIAQGRISVQGDPSALRVPGTIREIVAARIESLDVADRTLLELLSILGQGSPRALLTALAPDSVDVAECLPRLEQRTLVHIRTNRNTASADDGEIEPGESVSFQHTLTREAVYESMLASRRRELHARAAEKIEAFYQDRPEEAHAMLALHYLRAEKPEQAEPHLIAAGEQAVRSAASNEALDYFREAYRIHPALHGEEGDSETRFRLERQLALALMMVGDHEAARSFFDRVLTHLGHHRAGVTPRQANRQLVFDLLRIFARVYLLGGRMSGRAATESQRDLLDLSYERLRVESVSDPDRLLYDSMHLLALVTSVDPRTADQSFALYAGAALIFAYSGLSFRISRRFGRIAKKLMHEDQAEDVFTYQHMMFMCDYFDGSWDAECTIDDELIEKVLRTGRVWDVDTFVGMAFLKARDQGRLEDVERWRRRATELLEVYGYHFAATSCDAMDTFQAVENRDLEGGRAALARYVRHSIPMLNLLAAGAEARLLVYCDEVESAEPALERAERLLREAGRATPFHKQSYVIARAAFDVSQLEKSVEADNPDSKRRAKQARGSTRQAVDLAKGMAPIRVEAWRLAGEFEWLQGRPRQAIRWWERALDEADRLGARPETARTHLTIAERFGLDSSETASGSNAFTHLEKAASILSEIGCPRDRARAEELRKSGSDTAPASSKTAQA